MTSKGELVGVLGGHLYWQWATTLRDHLLQPLDHYRNIEIQILSGSGEVLLADGQGTDTDNLGSSIGTSFDLKLRALKSFQAAYGGEKGFLVEPWLGHLSGDNSEGLFRAFGEA